MNIDNIKAAFDILTKSQQRVTDEHMEFLKFYKDLVTAADAQTSTLFGEISVYTIKGRDTYTDGLSLTPTDYLWWSNRIKNGFRFKNGVLSAKADIFNKLASLSNAHNMTPEERKQYIELFEG